MISLLLSLLIIAALIAIHEFGHWLFGCILGIPKNKMSIQFFYRGKKKNLLNSMIFFALLDDNNQRISPLPDQNVLFNLFYWTYLCMVSIIKVVVIKVVV
jgi:hypothetical protein